MDKMISTVISLVVSSILLLLFTYIFLTSTRLSDITYLGLVTLSVLVGFVLFFQRSLKIIDIKNMRLILQKTQEVKSEIDHVAFGLAKIIANLSAYSTGTWVNRKKLNNDIQQLLITLGLNEEEQNKILELPRVVEKSMRNKEPLTKTEKKLLDEMFKLEEKKSSV